MNMPEDRGYLQRYAMVSGTYMGVFWILKFFLFPLGFQVPFCSLLFSVLTLAVPFMGYYYLKQYRDRACGGKLGFSKGVVCCVLMYVFASLLAAVAHYVYFRFMDHGFVVDSYIGVWEELISLSPSLEENKELITETLDTARALTPIHITMEVLWWDIFWGIVLALPTGLLCMRKEGKEKGTRD